MKLKRKHYFIIVLIGLTMTFLLGPKPHYPDYNGKISPVDIPIDQIESYITERESKVELLKPNNASFFQWANGSPQQTEYAVVFLHGFSASPAAGTPVATDFARRYGCNLYAPRIAGHGLNTEDSFSELSPADMVNSAKEALAIGKIIGKKTILIGSSTGCTLGAYLAAESPEYVNSMLFFSPNIELASKTSNMLVLPWGALMVRLFIGKYRTVKSLVGTPAEAYWTTKYRTEGLVALKYMLRETMTEATFKKINQPVYVGYYYKDEDHKDETVSIPAMKEFYAQLGTPAAMKRIEAIPEAGAHVMLSDIQCLDVDKVSSHACAFAEEILGMKPVGTQAVVENDTLIEDAVDVVEN
jgi:pimeloyl-ACP methyl ester carboxylesterase